MQIFGCRPACFGPYNINTYKYLELRLTVVFAKIAGHANFRAGFFVSSGAGIPSEDLRKKKRAGSPQKDPAGSPPEDLQRRKICSKQKDRKKNRKTETGRRGRRSEDRKTGRPPEEMKRGPGSIAAGNDRGIICSTPAGNDFRRL